MSTMLVAWANASRSLLSRILLSSVGGTIVAIRVTTGYRYLNSLLTASTILGSSVYPSSIPGWEVTIFVILSSCMCSAWASLATPFDAAMRLSELTGRGFVGSNSAGRLLVSQRAEGPSAETSPCCDRGAGGCTEMRVVVSADGQDVPA